MRTFVVGDIHGWADSLERLLERLRREARDGDSLVFIGDYIDRGPESRRVVDRVLRERREWRGPVVTLMGNHEAMLLDALRTWRTSMAHARDWLEAGDGAATIASYTEGSSLAAFEAALPRTHRRFYQSLPLWYEDEHGIYVHAGIPPGRRPEECGPQELLWIREPFIESDYNWGKPVVFGHTPQYDRSSGDPLSLEEFVWKPLNRPEKIGIDTGRGWGGPLTAVILPEREFLDANWLPF